MNQSRSFSRKVVYIVVIGCLLIPLSLVSRPATRDESNSITDAGGVLSALRDEHRLSQARLSEIDPGSETMKLASLGLRGLAVNLLWLKAIDAKDKKEWDTFSSTLNSLVKIQPNFIRVWEYQGHNLSYNVSVEFDDYEQRYNWVKKGIEFLTKGIAYNRRDHRIIDSLGFFSGNKFGTADEKTQYRRLFRTDDAFHDEMSRFVNIDKIDIGYGPDHWLLAYQWYDRSIEMVEKGIDETGPVVRHRKEMLFYLNKPAQLRNMGLALHSEFRSDEIAQANWQRAHDEWIDYGNRPLTATDQVEVSLESLMDSLVKIQNYRKQLDELAPGARSELLGQKLLSFTPEQRALLDRPIDQLTDEELEELRLIEGVLYGGDGGVDADIAMNQVPAEKREEAGNILKPLMEEVIRIKMGDHFRGTINYEHWRDQTLAEASDKGIAARQLQFDAMELRGQSIFDEYTQRNPVTGERQTRPGSIQKFDEAFNTWAEILDEHPRLEDGPMFDDIVSVIEDYMVVRQAAGNDYWPEDFVLQPIIDRRALEAFTLDDLPTSDEIAEQVEARERASMWRLPRRPEIDFKLDDESGPPRDDDSQQ